VLPPGELHPDLVNRLADEGTKAAGHVLNICIRALDYFAPVDPTFGDYLRALITADVDVVPDDPFNYRVAFIEAFRRYAICPRDVRSLSVESLLWNEPDPEVQEAIIAALNIYDMAADLTPDWVTASNRKRVYDQCFRSRIKLQEFLDQIDSDDKYALPFQNLWLFYKKDGPKTILRGESGLPKMEVQSIRPSHRLTPSGDAVTDLVISIIQKRKGFLDEEEQAKADSDTPTNEPGDFTMFGGCTILVDLDSKKVRYAIGKRVESERRLKVQRQYLKDRGYSSLHLTYLDNPSSAFALLHDPQFRAEPFALLHGV
jgi:hypothetical protein